MCDVPLPAQLLELMSTLEQAPSGDSDASKGGEKPPSDAAATGPSGLKVDRGIARRAAAEHVRTVRAASCAASAVWQL